MILQLLHRLFVLLFVWSEKLCFLFIMIMNPFSLIIRVHYSLYKMKPAIIIVFLLQFQILFAQTVISSKEFGNSRSLLIHELPYAQGIDDGFLIMKEERKGIFNLEKQDIDLELIWETRVEFDPQLDVPQLLVHRNLALLLSFTVRELERSATIELKRVDLTNGKIMSEAKHVFPQFQPRSPHPRISISNDLSKLLLSNHIPASTGVPELHILSTADLNNIKTVQLNKTDFEPPLINRFAIDNHGNVFFVSINESLFRMDGCFIPANGTEVRRLYNNVMFSRPLDNIAQVLIHAVEDSTFYIVSAAGNIQNELIGVKLAGYDFKNNAIAFDSVFDFTMSNLEKIYHESIPTSKHVPKRFLRTPNNLVGFHLNEMRVDDGQNIYLFFEKNLQKSPFNRGFTNANMAYIYNMNTKRKLQKSEDLMILSFGDDGGQRWGRVLQKHQVTKPFTYHLSYVSGFCNDFLSILTWTNKNRYSFQVTQFETQTGKIISTGVNILDSGKYTYHKNYTTWIDSNHLAITTQRNNRMRNREIQVVKIGE
jgi:hypothetical protein